MSERESFSILKNKVQTQSPESTRKLAREIAAFLKEDDIVLFYGELGSGKTLMIQEICSAMSIPPEQVTSPSFNIVRTYHSPQAGVYIHHFDFYRMDKNKEIDFFEFDDYLDEKGILLVEWAERIRERWLPGRVIRIKIRVTGETGREFLIEPWIFSD